MKQEWDGVKMDGYTYDKNRMEVGWIEGTKKINGESGVREGWCERMDG